MSNYKGACFCGSVEVTVKGEPIAQLVCHCKVCRSWSASPVNGACLWAPENVEITKGKESLTSFALNKGHDRSWCSKCGGHVLTDHRNTLGIIDVYGSVLEGFNFQPTAHVNYESTIMPINDDLPKFKDLPEDLGGSGEILS